MNPNGVLRRSPLVYSVDGSVAKVKISSHVTLIDAEDLHLLDGWTLSVSGRYVRLTKSDKGKTCCHTLLSRIIMNATAGTVVDHISGDKLDNRKINLRVCTHADNCRNTKGKRTRKSLYKGVCYCSWSCGSKKWRAELSVNKRRVYLGLHATEELAAQAYNVKATEVFGEFARLNQIVATR